MATVRALDDVWPQEKRDALRASTLAERKGFYSPWLHLAIPSTFALTAMTAAVVLLRDVRVTDVLFGLGLFLLANAVEWRIHKSLLHKRMPFATILYDRHTPLHHMVFVTDDMAVRKPQEFALVLLPAFAVVMLGVVLSPIIAALWFFFGQHNLACVFTFVTMGYVVTYEWLHLSYHLPPESFIGRLALVRFMRRHHAIHHDPRIMQKWNFNVSLPLWDMVKRTYVRTPEGQSLEPLLLKRS
jgi:hypothetical protein